MQDAAFNKAADPQPHRVLGLELLPFSIGHFILLQRHGSVFVSQEGGEPEIADLLLTVVICSQTYEEAKKSLRSRWLKWFMKFWGWKCRKLNFLDEARSFRDYMGELDNTPDIVVDLEADGTPKAKPSGAPWINLLRVFLMSELHLSPEKAMDYSLCQAQWDFWTHQALKGNDRLARVSTLDAARMAREEMN